MNTQPRELFSLFALGENIDIQNYSKKIISMNKAARFQIMVLLPL